MLFFDDRTQTPIITDMNLVRETVFDIIDGSFIEASLSERLSVWHILSLKNNLRTHYVFVNTHACAAVAPDGSPLPRILALAEFDGSAYGDALDRLVAVPGQGYFLTCLDGKLKRVDVVDGGGVPSLSMSDFGDADLNISDFGVTSSGDVLYWPATRDGGGSSDDERSRRSGERLPQTGDVTSAAAEGALLAAGGAALLTGYSVRRTQVERKQEQE